MSGGTESRILEKERSRDRSVGVYNGDGSRFETVMSEQNLLVTEQKL